MKTLDWFAVDRDGKSQKDLTPFEKVRAGVVDDLVDNPNEIVDQMNKRIHRYLMFIE